MKIYILNKDLPFLKKGAEFLFDELNLHYYCDCDDPGHDPGHEKYVYSIDEVEKFPKWFTEKETKVTGVKIEEGGFVFSFNNVQDELISAQQFWDLFKPKENVLIADDENH